MVELDVFPDLLDGVGARGLGGAVEEFPELRRDLKHLLNADVGTSFGSSSSSSRGRRRLCFCFCGAHKRRRSPKHCPPTR